MNLYLFDTSSARQRKRRLALTITVSMLCHGALVGGAAFLGHPAAPPPAPITTVPFETPGGGPDEPAASPEASVSTPEPEKMPTPAMTPPEEPPVDTPPVAPDPEMPDLMPATPPPATHHMVPSRPYRQPTTSTKTGPSGPVTGPQGSSGGNNSSGPSVGVRWSVSSKPAYSQALRAARVQGSVVIRITTDASGRVVEAVVVQSTGNALLDANTCQHARSFWSGPANASTNVPVTYRLQ